MLRGDPPPAMRWALRWRLLLVLLLAGLLGSPPCGGGISGVTADSSPPPPTTLTLRSVAGVSPSSVASGIVTTSTLTPPLGAPSSKPAALPTSSTSPVVVKSSKMPAVGTSVKTTTPSLPTKRGDTTTAAAPAVIAATTAASRAPTLAPVLATTHTTSSRGIAAKDLTSVSGPTTVTLSPSSPASIRPVGSTAKSPGPPLISAKPSAVAGVVIGPTTLATVATTKTAPTSKDKFSAALLTSPNTLVTTAMPKPSASPKSSTVHSSSSVSSTRPELKTAPPSLSSGTTTPQVSHVPSPSSRTNLSSVQGQTKIVCENNMPPKEKAIVLTLNASQPCNSLEGSPLKEALMEVLCKALKPNYNQNRDDCTIWLASDTEDLRRVAVVKTSVQTHFVDEELSEALAAKKAELEKFGVNNITYGGRPLDTEPKDHLSLPLIITIICMAASLLLVAAIYGCCHQRISQRKDQQRLTEELHTIENGYHDNPTLEVMETLSEMQEKKVNLNGELGDSWIVPMDSLTKDELDEEEDTHL